jgi:hypothetical protein
MPCASLVPTCLAAAVFAAPFPAGTPPAWGPSETGEACLGESSVGNQPVNLGAGGACRMAVSVSPSHEDAREPTLRAVADDAESTTRWTPWTSSWTSRALVAQGSRPGRAHDQARHRIYSVVSRSSIALWHLPMSVATHPSVGTS